MGGTGSDQSDGERNCSLPTRDTVLSSASALLLRPGGLIVTVSCHARVCCGPWSLFSLEITVVACVVEFLSKQGFASRV